MKNVSETSHAIVQVHVSISLNMLRLTALCSTNITAVWIEMNLIIIANRESKLFYFKWNFFLFANQKLNRIFSDFPTAPDRDEILVDDTIFHAEYN